MSYPVSGAKSISSQLIRTNIARSAITLIVIALLVAAFYVIGAKPIAPLKVVTLDFAYYNPSSLVLKKFGWLENDFKQHGIDVRWVHSSGSNRALEYLNGENTFEYLNGGSVQFASTAGLSAVLAKTKGSSIKAVYVYSRPEWTALVVGKNSNIKSVEGLRGKKIAATNGTDPYLFLLRTLKQFGIKKSEVEIVNLQHAEGRVALEQERVDAWAGLDPLMAESELENGSKLLYRNLAFNTYGFLNVNEKFAKDHPEAVKIVIENYELARKWIISNPEAAIKILSEEADISMGVARIQLTQRTDFNNSIIGSEHIIALTEAVPILMDAGLVKAGMDVNKAIKDLIDPTYMQAANK